VAKTTSGKKAVSKPQSKAPANTGRPTQTTRPVSTGATAAAPARARTIPAPPPGPEPEEELTGAGIEGEEPVDPADQIPEEGEAVASGDEVFDFSTDELEDPRIPKPDALRVRIVGVEEFWSERNHSPAILFDLLCDDLNKEIKFKVFVPRTFVEDLRISPKSLSKGEWSEEQQRKVGNESAQYAIAIHNQNNTAVVDRFRVIARSQGRTLEGVQPPDTFSDFITLLNEFLGPRDENYVNLVILRRANRKTGFLEIRQLLEPELVDTKPQIFDSYRKSWDIEEQ
jgi:hypothetical protein